MLDKKEKFSQDQIGNYAKSMLAQLKKSHAHLTDGEILCILGFHATYMGFNMTRETVLKYAGAFFFTSLNPDYEYATGQSTDSATKETEAIVQQADANEGVSAAD